MIELTKDKLIAAAVKGWEGIGFNTQFFYEKDKDEGGKEEITRACFIGAAAIGLAVDHMELAQNLLSERLYGKITNLNDTCQTKEECLAAIQALDF